MHASRKSTLVLVAFACSRSALDVPPSGPWNALQLDAGGADCVSTHVAVTPCSGLRVVTPKQPIDLDAAFVYGVVLVAKQGPNLELVAGDGRLVRLAVASDPPVAQMTTQGQLHLATNDVGFTAAATDGFNLYGCAEHDQPRFGGTFYSYDSLDASSGTIELTGYVQNRPSVAARDGLALVGYNIVAHTTEATNGRVFLTDGAKILWDRVGIGLPYAATSYECGLAYVSAGNGHYSITPALLTMLPFDGRPEASASFDLEWEPLLYSWPYDAQTVAILTRPDGPGSSPSAQCQITIRLVNEDGTARTRTIDHDCNFPIASEGHVQASLTMASFGAVLHDGAGNFQLLDENASPVGEVVSVPLIPYISDVSVGSNGKYVVVFTSEGDANGDKRLVSQTVLACAD